MDYSNIYNQIKNIFQNKINEIKGVKKNDK